MEFNSLTGCLRELNLTCQVLSKPFSQGDITITATADTPIDQLKEFKESHIQPLWHVIVLNLLTTCWYAPFWLFKNYRDLRRRSSESPSLGYTLKPLSINEAAALTWNKKINPFIWTIVSLLPYVGPVALAFFCKTIAQLYPKSDSPVRKHPLIAGIAIGLLIFATLSCGRLPDPYYFLYLTATIPMCVCQLWLNKYWESVEPEKLLVRQSFSSIELVLLIFGICLVGMHIVQHFFIGK